MLEHSQFVTRVQSGGVGVRVNQSAAMHVCDRSPSLPGPVKAAHHFWNWIAFLLILGGPISLIWEPWYVSLGAFVLGMVVARAVRRSAAEFVLEHSLANADFYAQMVSLRVIELDKQATDTAAPASRAAPAPSEPPIAELEPVAKTVLEVAHKEGLAATHWTKKKIEVSREGRVVAYIDRQRAENGNMQVIVRPDFDLAVLGGIGGLELPSAGTFFHSSNLRAFPKRQHRGENEIPHGYAIVAVTESAAGELFRRL